MQYVIWAISTLVAAFTGSYLGGYLKKKGENKALDEDIKKLVNQVQAVTQATKEIEAKISDEVWTRQRRWEVRRDAIFEALKELAAVRQSLRLLLIACDLFGARPSDGEQKQAQQMYIEKHFQALTGFARAKILALVACSKQVRDQFDVVEELADVSSKRALAGNAPEAYDKLHELWKAISTLVAMVRKDLGIDGYSGATPESGESSAGPNNAL